MPYRGRFAPSPTGPLHFGSLVAALGSWLRARASNGAWIVRIEDIDPPRERPGASAAILRSLHAHGLVPDEPVVYQSDRHALYQEALQALIDSGDAFHCACTRSDLAPSGIHNGACRRHATRGAWRMRVPDGEWAFHDACIGDFFQDSASVGDFVIWRADGLPAYQLAVVVDDDAQAISEVVRGADLLDSTPRQIHLQRRLGLPTPAYLHLPIVVDAHGRKLSKSLASAPIDEQAPMPALRRALDFLGQPTHPGIGNVDRLLSAAIAQFDVAAIPHDDGSALPPASPIDAPSGTT